MPIFKTLEGILGSGASKPVCLLVASEALSLLVLSWFWLLLAFSPFSLFSFKFCCSSRFCCFKQLFLVKIHHSLICSQQQWLLGFTLWVWEFDSCSSQKPERNCKAGTLEPAVGLQSRRNFANTLMMFGYVCTLWCSTNICALLSLQIYIHCCVCTVNTVPGVVWKECSVPKSNGESPFPLLTLPQFGGKSAMPIPNCWWILPSLSIYHKMSHIISPWYRLNPHWYAWNWGRHDASWWESYAE